MGGPCGTNGEEKCTHKFGTFILSERKQCKFLKADGRVVLQWILNKQDMMVWNGLIWPGIQRDDVCREYGELLDWL
jgi:hypothetical protein